MTAIQGHQVISLLLVNVSFWSIISRILRYFNFGFKIEVELKWKQNPKLPMLSIN